MTGPTEQRPPKYLNYLDSVRGIAAIMVGVYHYLNWQYVNYTGAKLGSIIFNGSDAVSFFFVLSGFVLSYKYVVLDQKLDLKRFFVTRIFRLWPAFFFILVIDAIYFNRHDLSTGRLKDVFLWDKTKFWEQASLVRAYTEYYFPVWTLTIELVLSFLVPFWVVIAKKDARLVLALLIVYLVIGNSMRDLFMFHVHFTLGVLISCIYPHIASWQWKQTKFYRYRGLLLLLALLLFSSRHLDRLWPLGDRYNYLANYAGITFFHYSAIGSFIFISAIIASKKAQKILENRLLFFFGKLSYGIYLAHWVLVTAVFDHWDKIKVHFSSVPGLFFGVFAIYFLATIILAIFIHYVVELPFMRLGKRLASKMKPGISVE